MYYIYFKKKIIHLNFINILYKYKLKKRIINIKKNIIQKWNL